MGTLFIVILWIMLEVAYHAFVGVVYGANLIMQVIVELFITFVLACILGALIILSLIHI